MAVSAAAAIVGGSIISGVLGAKAASKSAKASAKGQELGVAEQRRQFDRTEEMLRPQVEAGNLAREQQVALLGLEGEEAQQAARQTLTKGQQFIRDRAQKNLVRNASAIGGLGGGNVRTALVEQGAGFAAQNEANQFAKLNQLAVPGSQAAISTGQFGANAATNIQQGLIDTGKARSTGIVNKSNILQNAFSGVLQGASQGGFFNRGGGETLPASNINPFARVA